MAIAIGIVLATVGVLLLWYGQRFGRSLTRRAPLAGQPAEEPAGPETVPGGALGPDALVFLFPERFVGTCDDAVASPGMTGTAPLTQESIDLRDEAGRLVYGL